VRLEGLDRRLDANVLGTFVVVSKIEPACEKATGLGGKVMLSATAVPNVGRIAVILDDQGAGLGLFEPGMN
jgi:predicted enzyme related to lactoylglutathione lyase